MKVHRNFKATIGDRIVFRSSATRVYLSVSSTHSAIPVFHMHVRGQVTCTETGADKMKALRAQVKARVGEPAVLNAIESRSRDGMRVGLSPSALTKKSRKSPPHWRAVRRAAEMSDDPILAALARLEAGQADLRVGQAGLHGEVTTLRGELTTLRVDLIGVWTGSRTG